MKYTKLMNILIKQASAWTTNGANY